MCVKASQRIRFIEPPNADHRAISSVLRNFLHNNSAHLQARHYLI